MSALASFSNCRVRNQPFVSASSTAFFTMPIARSEAGVITTLAPRKRISLRRSTLKLSAMLTTSGHPFCAHTMARPMPVLPLVASITVCPGLSLPVRSASSITPSASRSFTEPSGLKASIFTYRSAPGGASLPIFTTGVLPIVSRMFAYLISGHLEKTGGAHAAANAHGHHDELSAPALAFDQRVPGEASAGHAVGMAEGDGAAVHVQAVVRDADTVAAVDHLHRESLVQLPQIDVFHLLSGLLQELRYCEHGADAHFFRIAARGGEAAEDAQRFQVAPRGFFVRHDYAGRSAIGELAGVAGGDAAALDRRLDLRHAFVGGVGANSLVLRRDDFLRRLVAGVLVDHLHLGGDRHDLVLELALGACLGRAVLALHAELVLLLARDFVAARHILGGLQHRPVGLRLVAVQPLVLEVVLVHLVLHQRDRLDAAGDEDLAFAGDDALRGERDCLQAGGAEAVHRHARHADRAAGADRDLARDVPAGRALGVGAADDHVFDLVGVDLGALERGVHYVAAHLRAVGQIERALPALAERGARGGNDHCVGHRSFPFRNALTSSSAWRLMRALAAMVAPLFRQSRRITSDALRGESSGSPVLA